MKTLLILVLLGTTPSGADFSRVRHVNTFQSGGECMAVLPAAYDIFLSEMARRSWQSNDGTIIWNKFIFKCVPQKRVPVS